MQKKQELETMTKKLAPLSLAMVAMLAGCSMIPAYERPAAPVPTNYTAASVQTGAPLPSWRNYFSEPRLQQLIELALDHNRDLRIASLNVEQARAQFQVRRAAQYPAVGLAANASRAPASGSGDLTNSFSVGLAVTAWELDFFGRVASLKEHAGIILINGCEPAAETLEKAEAEKIPVMVSVLPAFELSGRIYNLLTSPG